MSKLTILKKEAKKLYLEATDWEADCGRELAEYINPSIAVARQAFSKVWAEVRKLDLTAPNDPFEGINNNEKEYRNNNI